MTNPTQEDAINLATVLEQLLAPKYHVGLTGSQLYGSSPGHKATLKDIDLIVYPGTGLHGAPVYLDHMTLLLALQEAGLKFVRYAEQKEYGTYKQLVSDTITLPMKNENKMVWVMDYSGTRVDIQLRA